jgi:hypothetical protein
MGDIAGADAGFAIPLPIQLPCFEQLPPDVAAAVEMCMNGQEYGEFDRKRTSPDAHSN